MPIRSDGSTDGSALFFDERGRCVQRMRDAERMKDFFTTKTPRHQENTKSTEDEGESEPGEEKGDGRI